MAPPYVGDLTMTVKPRRPAHRKLSGDGVIAKACAGFTSR